MSNLPGFDHGENHYEDGPIVPTNGWSITVAELRAALEGVPDDYEVMLENAEVDDCEISNVNITRKYPPSITGSVGLVILSGGQTVSSEYDYHNRMDAHHEVGGDEHWSEKDKEWKK